MLSFDEFNALFCNEVDGDAVVTVCSDWAEPLFTAYDTNESGSLDQYEFAVLYDKFCPCQKSIEELFALYDINSDGVLNLEEYSLLLCLEL